MILPVRANKADIAKSLRTKGSVMLSLKACNHLLNCGTCWLTSSASLEDHFCRKMMPLASKGTRTIVAEETPRMGHRPSCLTVRHLGFKNHLSACEYNAEAVTSHPGRLPFPFT